MKKFIHELIYWRTLSECENCYRNLFFWIKITLKLFFHNLLTRCDIWIYLIFLLVVYWSMCEYIERGVERKCVGPGRTHRIGPSIV